MREGRIRPSLSEEGDREVLAAQRRNEGGANSPLVGVVCLASGSRWSFAAMREGRIRPSVRLPSAGGG